MATQDALERFNEYRARTPEPDESAVGSSPEADGKVTTTGDAEQMLARLKQNGTQDKTDVNMTTERVKSQRYGDVQYYTIESLDMDTLRDEVFPALDFAPHEKEAAGAIINNAGESNATISDRSGISSTTIGRVKGVLEGRQDPTEKQTTILKYAREHPRASADEIDDAVGGGEAYVRYVIRAFRHSRVEIEVPEEEQDAEDLDEEEPESDERDAVEKDLAGEDVTHKYDTSSPNGKARPETLDGRRLDTIQEKSHLLAILQEYDKHFRNIKEAMKNLREQVEEDDSSELKGRLVALENRLDGVQSVVDRIEDQQANVERYVEDNMVDTEQHGSTVSGLKRLSNEQDEMDDRLEAMEESLKSHKEAIQDLRDGGGVTSGAEFSGDEKKEIIVALVENGNEDLIGKVIDDL